VPSTTSGAGSGLFDFFMKDEVAGHAGDGDTEWDLLFRARIGAKQLGPEIEVAPAALRFGDSDKLVCSVGCLYDLDQYEPLLACGIEYRFKASDDGWGTFGLGCFGSCALENSADRIEVYGQLRYRITPLDIGYKPEGLLEEIFGRVGLEPSVSCGSNGDFDVSFTLSFGSLF
jgi:hypothetical protein